MLTTRHCCSFLNTAVGSASELAYLLRVANELQFLPQEAGAALQARADAVVRQLKTLHSETERLAQLEAGQSARTRRPKAESPESKVQHS